VFSSKPKTSPGAAVIQVSLTDSILILDFSHRNGGPDHEGSVSARVSHENLFRVGFMKSLAPGRPDSSQRR
jgi:hypothetical protein